MNVDEEIIGCIEGACAELKSYGIIPSLCDIIFVNIDDAEKGSRERVVFLAERHSAYTSYKEGGL